jgi:hypothetical protein
MEKERNKEECIINENWEGKNKGENRKRRQVYE